MSTTLVTSQLAARRRPRRSHADSARAPAARLPSISLGVATPRVQLGHAVLQRAVWQVDAGEIDRLRSLPPARRYLATVELLTRRGVPRRVFAKLPGERKPLHIDLASPHLVELLLTSARPGTISLTEMLPGPGELWQLGPDGRRVCELRLAYLRVGEDGRH